jgi:hypothetical protein
MATRERDTGVYEMQWDCKFCGTKKLLGQTHRFCPNCGAAQDPATRYFPSDDEKVAVKDHVYYGVDRLCPACSTPNSANSHNCRQCGAPLENAAQAALVSEEVRRSGEKFVSSGSRDVAGERLQADLKAAEPEKKGVPRWILALAVIMLLVCGGLSYAIFTTRETGVRVVSHTWERKIDVEEYSAVSDNAWCDSMPGGAYNISRRNEIRDYRQIPDGETCRTRRIDNGDGTYRQREECETKYRSEPIYDDKCYYTIDRWVHDRTEVASGTSMSPAPFWPETNITSSAGCTRLGCEREGGRGETYTVTFKNTQGEDVYECDFNQEQWQSLSIESLWQMDVNLLGIASCDTLRPNS